jgi:hypothetical protein
MATMAEYINRYKAIKEEHERTRLFHQFTRYITASCWRKMQRRVNHWSSLGFLYILGSLDKDPMQSAFNLFKPTRNAQRKDSALANMLKEETVLSNLSKEYRSSTGVVSQLPEFRRLAAALQQNNSESGQSLTLPYNQDTFFEFHQLLVATLLGFRESLQLFSKAMNTTTNNPSVEEKEKLERLARRVLQFSRMLWRIAYSHMLTQHLAMLEGGSFLQLPSDSSLTAYKRYVEWDPDAEDVDEDDMDDQLQMARNLVAESSDNVSNRKKIFLHWLRLLISHWGALDIMSAYSASHRGKDVDFSLVSVKASFRGSGIRDWRESIRSLALASNDNVDADGAPVTFDANRAIEAIETRLKSEPPAFDSCNIFKAFKPDPPKRKSVHSSSPNVVIPVSKLNRSTPDGQPADTFDGRLSLRIRS